MFPVFGGISGSMRTTCSIVPGACPPAPKIPTLKDTLRTAPSLLTQGEMLDSPVTKAAAAIIALPVLVTLCLLVVFLVLDTSRRKLGESGVSYRPFRHRIADFLLILKLWWRK